MTEDSAVDMRSLSRRQLRTLHRQRCFSTGRHSRRVKPRVFGPEGEAVGVAYRAPAVVVVETDAYILAAAPEVSEATGPIREGRPAVAGSRMRSALVQAYVSPLGREPERRLPLRVSLIQRPLCTAARCPDSSVYHDSWRGSNATLTFDGKAARVDARRAGSARKFAESCSRIGPTFYPSPLERSRSRRTGSVGLLSRSTWVR